VPADIINDWTCGQYFADFAVTGSRGDVYVVRLDGPEGMASCECKAWEFAPIDGKDCKHIRKLWAHACLRNPQWHDGGPNDYTEHDIELRRMDVRANGSPPCPACGGPQVLIKIAV
jgi:hypothetical protein